jgi:hypothetical protein
MVRVDTNHAPSSVQQAADTIEQRVDFRIYLTNKESIERVPQRVELTALSPTAPFATNGHFGLVGVEGSCDSNALGQSCRYPRLPRYAGAD